MKRQDFRHFYQDNVRWGDCDQLGHLNNTVYLQFIESGRLDYFDKVMDLELRPDSTSGWVMADLQCSFKEQVHFPCKLEIATRKTKVGNSSTLMESAIFKVGSDEPVFTAVVTSVWCDYTQGKSARVPDNIRAAIKQYESNVEGL